MGSSTALVLAMNPHPAWSLSNSSPPWVTTLSAPVKGKNNPLNFDAVPKDYEDEARARNMNPRMLVEFVDGSKTMVEMSAIANATGLVPDIDGMHGPAARLKGVGHHTDSGKGWRPVVWVRQS